MQIKNTIKLFYSVRASGSISMDRYVPSNTSIRFSLNQFENGTFEKRIIVTGHKIAD